MESHGRFFHLAVGSADDNQPASTSVSSDHRLVSQAGKTSEVLTTLGRNPFRHESQAENPLVLYIQMNKRVVFVLIAIGDSCNAVTGEHDFCLCGRGPSSNVPFRSYSAQNSVLANDPSRKKSIDSIFPSGNRGARKINASPDEVAPSKEIVPRRSAEELTERRKSLGLD